MSAGRPRLAPLAAGSLAVLLAFVALQLANLSHPLLWHDESETAMFARRVLQYGFPKVHGERNVVYSLWQRGGVGIHEETDAYTGSPWGQYYFGALAVALSDTSGDLYARTGLLRLPFALAGLAGLAAMLAAVLPALRGGRARWLFALLFGLLLLYSVSLQLHLREARHYPLVVLELGILLWLFLRRHVFASLGSRGYAVGTVLALLALFHTFHPAFAAFGLAAVAWHGGGASSRRQPWRNRLAQLLGELAPLLLAAALALPALLFFDFLDQTRGWVERFSDAGTTLGNLGFVAWTLLRYDFLAPALLLRLALLAGARDGPAGSARRAAGFLALLVTAYAVVIAQVPFVFERYFVALSPLVSLWLLLDAFSLREVLQRGPRPLARALAALAALVFLVVLGLRWPELQGRLYEAAVPYRGPLDFVIPYLAERYERPEELVIATNYEGPAYMFYLGSRVTIGFYGANLDRDLEVVPDVIVPRSWPEHLEILKALSEQRPYAAREFPVTNLPWNNSPALSPRLGRPTAHRFRTPRPEAGEPALVILERPTAG